MMKKLYYVGLLLLAVTLLAGCRAQPKTPGVTLEAGRRMAEDFVRTSPTFSFDGIEGSLRLADTLETSEPGSWTFVFEFDSRQAGYGDRTGRMLAQVITRHVASVTVDQGEIVYASLDGEWDMLEQTEQSGAVVLDPGTPAPVDFVGWVTDVSAVGRDGILGVLMVESQVDKLVDKYAITVTEETVLMGLDAETIGFDAFETTQQVRVWFSGPVKESFPMQVDAGMVVISQAARGD